MPFECFPLASGRPLAQESLFQWLKVRRYKGPIGSEARANFRTARIQIAAVDSPKGAPTHPRRDNGPFLAGVNLVRPARPAGRRDTGSPRDPPDQLIGDLKCLYKGTIRFDPEGCRGRSTTGTGMIRRVGDGLATCWPLRHSKVALELV